MHNNKTEVFTSMSNSLRTSQLAVEKHSFLLKCWFTISYDKIHVICSILILFTSCQHRYQYYSVYRQLHNSNFRTNAFFVFLFKAYVTSKCCMHETWSLEFCMISGKQFICCLLLFYYSWNFKFCILWFNFVLWKILN